MLFRQQPAPYFLRVSTMSAGHPNRWTLFHDRGPEMLFEVCLGMDLDIEYWDMLICSDQHKMNNFLVVNFFAFFPAVFGHCTSRKSLRFLFFFLPPLHTYLSYLYIRQRRSNEHISNRPYIAHIHIQHYQSFVPQLCVASLDFLSKLRKIYYQLQELLQRMYCQ